MTRQILSGGRRFCKGSFGIQQPRELLSYDIITNVMICGLAVPLWDGTLWVR